MPELNFEEPEYEFPVYPVSVATGGTTVYEIDGGQKINVSAAA